MDVLLANPLRLLSMIEAKKIDLSQVRGAVMRGNGTNVLCLVGRAGSEQRNKRRVAERRVY